MIKMPCGFQLKAVILPLMLVVLATCVSALAGTSHNAAAQSSGQLEECRVLLMLDKSASIGDNWGEMRTQVDGLFTAPKLQVEGVALGYWTFSNNSNPSGSNFNAPYHNYVRTAGDPTGYASFMNTLPVNGADVLGGQTNYEQAFGYHNGLPNNQPSNSGGVGNIRDMRENADVLVLLTDGLPNYPVGPDGSPLDGNQNAVSKGRAARENYENKTVIGAYITNNPNPDLSSLNMTINGSPTDQSNIGPLNFASIEGYLTEAIANACDVSLPNYNLKPIVQANDSVVSSGAAPTFDYSVRNDTDEGTSGTSSWQIYDVTINPDVNGNPLACGTNSYCDNIPDCTAIRNNLLGGRGTCQPSGDNSGNGNSASSDSFPPDVKELHRNRPATVANIDDLPLGTRICRVLQLRTPTGSGSPQNRIYGACSVIAKAPLVQIHGGDLRVGRHFSDDSTTPDPNAGVYVSRFKISKEATVVPNGRTYGSWVEYGVLAPGPIRSMASLSGYAGLHGGYDGPLSTASCDLNINKLTFANIVADQAHQTECGYLAENPGLIPDAVSSLTATTPINSSSYSVPLKFDQNSPTGLYKNEANNVNFEINGGTVGKGKTFIVYVPHGTVTITDNINYVDDANDKYGSITDIPQVVIIAKDINIRENVVRVDAWLIAAGNNSGGGKIETCFGFARPLSAKVCKQELRINGPVMARQIDLWRTKVDESGCTIAVVEDCKFVSSPAEIINLPGSSTLWAQSYGLNPSRAQTTYTNELPPYF